MNARRLFFLTGVLLASLLAGWAAVRLVPLRVASRNAPRPADAVPGWLQSLRDPTRTLRQKIEAVQTAPRLGREAKHEFIANLQGEDEDRIANDHPGEALRYYLAKREDHSGRLRVENYLAARQRFATKRSLASVVPAANPLARRGPLSAPLQSATAPLTFTWSNIGPANIGGRTRAILVQDTSPRRIYAAGVDGGVWESLDDGASWTALDDLMPSLAINTLAADPANPDTIYAGTGEGSLNIDAVRGNGIFVTTDAGNTWTQQASTADNAKFSYVNKIVVSPNDSAVLYAATNYGLMKSLDGGTSWTAMFYGPPAFDVAVSNVGGSDYVYVYMADYGLYRSTTGGSGMEQVFGSSSSSGSNDFWRGGIAVSKSDPSVAYVSVSKADGTVKGLWKTTDRFATASQVLNLDTSTAAGRLNSVLFSNPYFAYSPLGDGNSCAGQAVDTTGQGWYDQVIAVDPTNPSIVWVGGVDLFRSDDGGVNFKVASVWYLNPSLTSPTAGAIHADHHAIVFSPTFDGSSDTAVYFGNDGGVYKSTTPYAAASSDPCLSTSSSVPAVTFLELNNGYGVTQFYHGSVPTTGTGYIGGTQDNGTLKYAGSGTDWSSIYGGDGGYTAIDPTNPDVMYYSYVHINVVRSDDGGNSSTAITSGITSGGSGQFINPFALDSNPGHTTRLYVTNRDLWMTDDATQNPVAWTDLGQLDASRSASALAVAPGNSNVMYVGLDNGTFYRVLNP